jgi:branched-subunit amino acid aminotransferase/4-amino-4-deoxychorismate lyase
MSDLSQDRGLLLGDGLFETVLWREGELVLFDRHVDRLARSCMALGLPKPEAHRLETAARDAVTRAGIEGRAAVRLTWTAGGSGRGLDRPEVIAPALIAKASSVAAAGAPVRLTTVSVRRNEGSPASRLKTLAYLDNVLARAEARAAGTDDGLMLNNAGMIACAAAANLFWFEGERLLTPALACGVLDGVMRGVIIDAATGAGIAVEEVAAPRARLAAASGLFLTNSLVGIAPVASLDGVTLPSNAGVERLVGISRWSW